MTKAFQDKRKAKQVHDNVDWGIEPTGNGRPIKRRPNRRERKAYRADYPTLNASTRYINDHHGCTLEAVYAHLTRELEVGDEVVFVRDFDDKGYCVGNRNVWERGTRGKITRINDDGDCKIRVDENYGEGQQLRLWIRNKDLGHLRLVSIADREEENRILREGDIVECCYKHAAGEYVAPVGLGATELSGAAAGAIAGSGPSPYLTAKSRKAELMALGAQELMTGATDMIDGATPAAKMWYKAKIAATKKWYRAKITRVNADGTYHVTYRDDGLVSDKIHRDDIRMIPEPTAAYNIASS